MLRFTEAKEYEGEMMTLLEMDNLFEDDNSIFGGEGKYVIKELRKDKEGSFSYNDFNVFFSLIEDNKDAFKIEILINHIEEY